MKPVMTIGEKVTAIMDEVKRRVRFDAEHGFYSGENGADDMRDMVVGMLQGVYSCLMVTMSQSDYELAVRLVDEYVDDWGVLEYRNI